MSSNGSDVPSAEALAEEEHVVDSYLLLTMLLMLFLSVLVIWRFHLRRFLLLHETGVSLLIGFLAGFIISAVERPLRHHDQHYHPAVCNVTARNDYKSAVTHEQYVKDVEAEAVFNSEIFFYVLLPPIIFYAGYDLKQKHFFRNIGAVLAYAFVGTTVSFVLTGGLLWGYVSRIGTQVSMSMNDCFLFGALLSATDPVTVLAIFNDMQVDDRLYALVFGESVLNDAVAIVLSRSVENFAVHDLNTASLFYSLWVFLLIFFGSFACGAFMGMFTSVFLKFTNMKNFPLLETTIFVIFSYSAFLLAEGAGLTGIIATLFCGITQAHYTYSVLSEESKYRTKKLYELLNFMAENFIFSYMGLNFFTYKCHRWDPSFIAFTIFVIILARAAHIFPLTYMINRLNGTKKKPISIAVQIILLWSGLRGAIAFALAINNTDTASGQLMLTSTLVIVLATVLCFGGTTSAMLKLLGIKTGIEAQMPDPAEQYVLAGTTVSRYDQRNKSWLARTWQGMDRKLIRPFVTATEDNQGLESPQAVCRTITNYFKGIRETPQHVLPPQGNGHASSFSPSVPLAAMNGGAAHEEPDVMDDRDRTDSVAGGDLGASWAKPVSPSADKLSLGGSSDREASF